MPRYVLYYSPGGEAPRNDMSVIRRDPAAAVIAAQHDVVLVDSNEAFIERFLAQRPRWQVTTGSAVRFPVETGLTRARRGR